jgi:hypothetical protein
MKIAIVAQHATPCTRAPARALRPDDAGLSELPGRASIQLAWRRGAAGPRQRGPGHAATSQAPARAGNGPTRTVFAGAVTKTARLLANKGPQSTYVRNS